MPRGVLVIRVKEASGKNKSESVVWDPNFIEGFVRAELRTPDGKKTNVQSISRRVIANQITWDEELRLEVSDTAKELRLMLCREKRTGTRVGTSVIAACGIFVNDILEAVPIDKYFELFKPGAAGEGGFIRIGIDYEDHTRRRGQANGVPSPAMAESVRPKEFRTQVSLDTDPSLAARGAMPGSSTSEAAFTRPSRHAPSLGHQPAPEDEKKPRGKPVLKAGLLLAAIGAVVFAVQKKKLE